ncbi:MAG: hypothetical protein ACLQD9_05815 [Thermoplasmata archaeon]
MPLVIKLAEIPGLDADSPAFVRDVAVSEFLGLSRELWECLTPEFTAHRVTVFETFPGEHLGGTRVKDLGGQGSTSPEILSMLSPASRLPYPGSQDLKVHAQHSLEVEGELQVDGLPNLLAVLQLNLYRAWAEGAKGWGGAGDIVFEVLKTGEARFDGLWGVCSERTRPMIPVLKKWVQGISKVSHQKHGRHRVQWAALTESGGAESSPESDVYLLYRSRMYGRGSLMSACMRTEAAEELSDLLGDSPDSLRRGLFRQAVGVEVDTITATPAFQLTADQFQGADLAAYSQGGSEYFVFTDPTAPQKAARKLVKAIRPRLEVRVKENMGEGAEWNEMLSKLVTSRAGPSRRRDKLDSY